MKIVLCTGGFDPIHSGHISYLTAAKQLGDLLIVGINSDEWLIRKKNKFFMPIKERISIVSSLSVVDEVITFDDSDNSACNAIHLVRQKYKDATIIFANGGDRNSKNTIETSLVDTNLEFAWSVGGNNKANSSSWILESWLNNKTDRVWGYYKVLHEHNKTVKVKELTVDINKKLSMQKHSKRAEFWFVAKGIATVYTLDEKNNVVKLGNFSEQQYLWIPVNSWHQLANEHNVDLHMIEIQFGEECVEDDIIRL